MSLAGIDWALTRLKLSLMALCVLGKSPGRLYDNHGMSARVLFRDTEMCELSKIHRRYFWQSRTHPLPNPKFILGETSSRKQAGQEPELSALGRTASTFEEK
jgi:hypothetical protein